MVGVAGVGAGGGGTSPTPVRGYMGPSSFATLLYSNHETR